MVEVEPAEVSSTRSSEEVTAVTLPSLKVEAVEALGDWDRVLSTKTGGLDNVMVLFWNDDLPSVVWARIHTYTRPRPCCIDFRR